VILKIAIRRENIKFHTRACVFGTDNLFLLFDYAPYTPPSTIS
jgi:hypothetical protein